MKKSELVTYRLPLPGDVPFIFSTMLKGLRYGCSRFANVPTHLFYKAYHATIEKLLTQPGVIVNIAALKDDPDVILGYSVISGSTVHWVYVKKAWRKLGLAKDLMPVSISKITHMTDNVESLVGDKLRPIYEPLECKEIQEYIDDKDHSSKRAK